MREKAGAQRRLLSAREEEAGKADVPHPCIAPSCGGIRAVGDLAHPQLWGGCGSGGWGCVWQRREGLGSHGQLPAPKEYKVPRSYKTQAHPFRNPSQSSSIPVETIVSTPDAFSNSKQILYKENFICKNISWPHRLP